MIEETHAAGVTARREMKFWRKPLDRERVVRPRGEVVVQRERCKGCSFCTEYCPQDVLALSTEFNEHGYHFPVAIKPDLCLDCKLCQNICPEFAIFVLSSDGGKPDDRAG